MEPEKLASKWISEMEQMGMGLDDMLRVIQMAREKYREKEFIAKINYQADEDDGQECCDYCGCHHGHHPWCNESDEDDL